MAILLRTRQNIDRLRAAGKIVAETYEVLRPHVCPGVSTADLDRIAESYIRAQGAFPTYKGYTDPRNSRGQPIQPPFPASICVAVNEVICHGVPSSKLLLEDGDIIGIDIGVTYRGWVGDSCVTFAVGTVDEESQHLLQVATQCLELGIGQAAPGNHLGDIGAAISEFAVSEGFSVVRKYGGHGVGRTLHEDPWVPHFGTRHTGVRLVSGMVIAIEPMVNAGGAETRVLPDKWAVATADGSRSAQFEHTIAVTDDGPEILTTI